jgi:hypothetical protein
MTTTAGSESSENRGRGEGERAKSPAIDLWAARRELLLKGRRTLVAAALCHGTASADDVRARVDLPPGVDPKCFGLVPGPLVRARVIEPVGVAQTRRPIAHARHVTVWKLVDPAVAATWLTENSEQRGPASDRQVAVQGFLFPLANNEPARERSRASRADRRRR